jgi:hypothetical protein
MSPVPPIVDGGFGLIEVTLKREGELIDRIRQMEERRRSIRRTDNVYPLWCSVDLTRAVC